MAVERGAWTSDSKFFVFNAQSTGGQWDAGSVSETATFAGIHFLPRFFVPWMINPVFSALRINVSRGLLSTIFRR